MVWLVAFQELVGKVVDQLGDPRVVERLLAKEWGPYTREDILDLLREIEGQMLANIQVKALEGPRFAEMAEEVSERTQREFEALAGRVDQAFEGG